VAKEKKTKKRPNSSNKGSAFERLICKQLSLWWTDGDRDDVFWRTSNSGGRATIRGRQSKETFGQYGDIQATDPIGQPLMNACAIECKKGYKQATLSDIIDRPDNLKRKSEYQKFVEQAITQADAAKAPFWMLITKRDARNILIAIPWELYLELAKRSRIRQCCPQVFACVRMDKNKKAQPDKRHHRIFITTLEEFFTHVPHMSVVVARHAYRKR